MNIIFIFILFIESLACEVSTTECPECITLPLMLSTGDGVYEMTNIIVHAGDDIDVVASEICMTINADISLCSPNVKTSLSRVNWIEIFDRAWKERNNVYPIIPSQQYNKNDYSSGLEISRQTAQAIYKRLRLYPAPRRLLIIGSDEHSRRMFHSLNNIKNGGFTNFVSHFINSTTITTPSSSEDIFERMPAELLQIFHPELIDDEIFQRNRDDISFHFSSQPWDVVILYDFCPRIVRADMIQTCTQSYLDYAADIVSDTGYVFIIIPTEPMKIQSAFHLDELNFSIPENKFRYRNEISKHIGDNNILTLYYTNEVIDPFNMIISFIHIME
jgi:hypothetical protein